jgi:hypothetical protein
MIMTDVVVRDTESQLSDGRLGRGLQVLRGSAIVARALFDNNRADGVLVTGDLTMSDAVIRGTRVQACQETTCSTSSDATGLALIGGQANLQLFRIEDSALIGVQVIYAPELIGPEGRMPSLTATNGTVRGGRIGANIQVDGFDYDASFVDVEFIDSEVKLSADSLPVPDLGDLLPPPPR